MVSELGELIARYEAAQQRIAKLVETAQDSEAELLAADAALSKVFDAILNLRLQSTEQTAMRVKFLMDVIMNSHPQNSLVHRMCEHVLQDLADCQTATE